MELFCSFKHQPNTEILDNAIEQCGFVLKEEAEAPLPKEKLDDPTTKVWTGYFTDNGKRVNTWSVYQINNKGYIIREECVCDKRKFIAVDGNGKKHELKDLFKYHKP